MAGYQYRASADRLRVLVVGEAGVGKTTLVTALCGSHNRSIIVDGSTVGCVVSVRVDTGIVQEFYDLCGRMRFAPGRRVFYRATDYDALLLVHDLTDRSSRAALSSIWVPETMAVFGDIKAVDAGGRRESAASHVRVQGVLDELRVLWLHCRSKHAGLNPFDAAREAVRLCSRLVRLVLNEYGVWTDKLIDLEAERELLSSCVIPVAIVGLKRDLVRPLTPSSSSVIAGSGDSSAVMFAASSTASLPGTRGELSAQSSSDVASVMSLTAFDAADDPSLTSFFCHAIDCTRRRSTAAPVDSPRAQHVSLPF
jgi:energy-coupling factor transporter ATP-binding protein EcfA2